MACERAGIVFTVYAGCPARHRLNFLYPIIIPPDLWLSGPTDAGTRTVMYNLPVRCLMHLIGALLVLQLTIRCLVVQKVSGLTHI